MNRNDALKEIKENLKKLFSASVEKKFSTFVLTDGTKITTEAADLTVGAEVYALDEQSNQTPLNDGDYVINDGRTITVEANKIKEVKLPEDTQPEGSVEDANTANTTDTEQKMESEGTPATPSEESDLATRVTDLESKLAEVMEMLKSVVDATKSTSDNVEEMGKKFAELDLPAEEAIKTKKKGYDAYDKKSIADKKKNEALEEVREFIKNKESQKSNRY